MPGAADTREAGRQKKAELALSLSADCRLTKHTGHVDRHTHTHKHKQRQIIVQMYRQWESGRTREKTNAAYKCTNARTYT